VRLSLSGTCPGKCALTREVAHLPDEAEGRKNVGAQHPASR
jgi:hypothetical protein